MKGEEGIEEVKDLDMVMDSGRRIARESPESAYSRARERYRKTEIVDDGNSVE